MTSIIVYDPALDGSETEAEIGAARRKGMVATGKRLRSQLEGCQLDAEVEAAVNRVVGRIAKRKGDLALLEAGTRAKPVRYKIQERKKTRFPLTNFDDPTDDKRRLKLKGVIDDSTDPDGDEMKRNFRMTTVSPYDSDEQSWNYLATVIFQDLLEIEGINHTIKKSDKIENYLIATFAFTRCR